MGYEERAYHGIQGDNFARIFAEEPEIGPPQREHATVINEIRCESELNNAFRWGYDGSGPSRAAAAILADALDLGDPAAVGMALHRDREADPMLAALREDTSRGLLQRGALAAL